MLWPLCVRKTAHFVRLTVAVEVLGCWKLIAQQDALGRSQWVDTGS